MVFQHFELFPHLSIIENLTLAQVKVLKRDKAAARDKGLKLLERVGLSAHANKFPAQLSGGQQAACGDCPCAVYGSGRHAVRRTDFCTRSRDDQRSIRCHGGTAHEGMTMMVVTHEMGFARKVANRVIFMDEGKIVEDAEKEAFFANPKSDRAKDFLAKILH
ncbi:Arginine transport ATP-binding protein ArtM [Kluyvera cryocrescens]|uniref:Arginine transport ATP-binding protein ArtM n=1 Tax=Kluyvera cryocrescens TaxID=580 RepID=A0A485CL15_KLUCR|nr:Arginine transport ATP-binding protein ArtM [Kluyvera cryocrescens]